MAYNKRIICDIDDTISFTTNRDWEYAEPNTRLINKLNYLYNNGWEICYFTARGNISFSSRDKADKFYRPIIEKWFEEHSVLYSELSFNKPLASYYIDDKSITPEEFVKLNIEILEGGLSGACVERRGNKVFKTHPNSLETAVWYREAENIIKTIKIHSLIANTICMDFIEKTDEPKTHQIDFIINKFKEVPTSEKFETYINHLSTHFDLYNPTYKKDVYNALKKYEKLFNDNRSFCHGDMSLDNMINSNDILYLIDPNKPKGIYSSWMLDLSKVLHSARRFNKPNIYTYFIHKYHDIQFPIRLLELTHWIRMRKYENFNDIHKLDNIINSIIDELFNVK